MPTVSNAEQQSEEWFQARLGCATGSRFNDVIAKTRSGYSTSRKNYAVELALEIITGTRQDFYQSSAMAWGTETEPVARLEYELITGNEVEETGFWKHDILPIGASPDGLVNKDGLLEIKCPNSATHLETLISGKVPRQYIAQVQGQLLITERNWADFVSYDPRMPENAKIKIIRVERDEAYIRELIYELEEFVKEVDEQVQFIKNYKG